MPLKRNLMEIRLRWEECRDQWINSALSYERQIEISDVFNLLDELEIVRSVVQNQRRMIAILAKGDPEAAELVIARICETLDSIDEDGVWPEKVEMAVASLVDEVRRSRRDDRQRRDNENAKVSR